MSILPKRVVNNLKTFIKKNTLIVLGREVNIVKQMIMDSFDTELSNVVINIKSKTNPILYRDTFEERLESFNFIEDSGNSIEMNVPTMENFDFSGGLRVLERIMEGTVGVYVEMDAEDFMSIFKRRPRNEEHLWVRYGAKIIKAEQDLNKKFVRNPFSNTPPIRIFEAAEMYVDNNMKRWIRESLKKGLKEFVTFHKGVRL